MRHIEAWSVDGFLPLFFSTLFEDGFGGTVQGGAHYVPPALHVDAMVCQNTGADRLSVEDVFGAQDSRTGLRPYSSATPPDQRAFGWQPFDLEPGASVVVIQRLLFSAFDRFDPATDRMETFARAVYAPTHLPKGVIVNGESFPFDGRSHNAIIVASFVGRGSCPFLSSWCDRTQEWVRLGKILTRCDQPDREGEECRDFTDLRTRFKLVEREHERTTLRGATLEIETRDGAVIRLSSPIRTGPENVVFPWTLDIGQSVEFAFAPAPGLDPDQVVRTRLRLRGHYRNYLQRDLKRCAEHASM